MADSKHPGNSPRSASLSRRVQVYPSPLLHSLTVGYTTINEMTESEAVCVILKDFFNRLPEDERRRYLAVSKNRY